MILNQDNYYDDRGRIYMSCSTFQNYMTCEAMAQAIEYQEWKPEKPVAMQVGSYIHSHFESPQAKQKFISENPDMFLKNGGLKSEYRQADEMIKALEDDPFCMMMLEGHSEYIMTAELFGLPWKIRIDKWNPDKRRIIDIKSTASINEKSWKDGIGKVSFIEQYDYMLRAAIYSEVVRQNIGDVEGNEGYCDYYIVAVSKENPPDKAVIKLTDPVRFSEELDKVEHCLDRIKLIKCGILHPIRCEKCQYCRSTKVLSKVVYYRDL
jgi:hypothetical protein